MTVFRDGSVQLVDDEYFVMNLARPARAGALPNK